VDEVVGRIEMAAVTFSPK